MCINWKYSHIALEAFVNLKKLNIMYRFMVLKILKIFFHDEYFKNVFVESFLNRIHF